MGCYNLPSLDGEDHVHIIVLDIMQGLQWSGLFHILASRSKKIHFVRSVRFPRFHLTLPFPPISDIVSLAWSCDNGGTARPPP